MSSSDVLVVGAGLAGLHTATLLAEQGHDVLLVERRTNLSSAIRTTGIFVRKTLDDFPLPAQCLGPPIRRVALYPPDPRRPVILVSGRDEYRVGDMAPLYLAAAQRARESGVRIVLGTRYAGRVGDAFVLAGRDGPTQVRARYVVGADGARSRVARDLSLDRNRHLLIGAEEVFAIPGSDEAPTFHCVLDPSLAPGYLAWVVNDGGVDTPPHPARPGRGPPDPLRRQVFPDQPAHTLVAVPASELVGGDEDAGTVGGRGFARGGVDDSTGVRRIDRAVRAVVGVGDCWW